MRRPLTTLAGLLMLSGLALARPAQNQPPSSFQPAEVASTVDPVYPITSIAWGTVVLQVSVDESGKVKDIAVVKDIPSLTVEAKRAVKQWKFKPARLAGQPVPSVVPVAVTFVASFHNIR